MCIKNSFYLILKNYQIQNGKYKTKEGINMINIAICDDDTFFIDYIEKVIVKVNGSDKDIDF